MKTGEKMPKIACFTSKNCLFHVARLTILRYKVDYFGLQGWLSWVAGHSKRLWKWTETVFINVNFNFFRCQDFSYNGMLFAGQQRRTSGCLKTLQAKNCRCGNSGNKKKVVMTHHGDGHDDLFLLCRYCETGCAHTFMTPCWASLSIMMSIACVLEQMAITVLRNYLQNILFIGWF